jgi:hypothetical protein
MNRLKREEAERDAIKAIVHLEDLAKNPSLTPQEQDLVGAQVRALEELLVRLDPFKKAVA